MPFVVRVADNFHYMNEDETFDEGTYETAEQALEAARRIVDRDLEHILSRAQAADDLYELYIMFGSDPYVVPIGVTRPVLWSAWDYARSRCPVLLPLGAQDWQCRRSIEPPPDGSATCTERQVSRALDAPPPVRVPWP